MSLSELEFYNVKDFVLKLDKHPRASLTLEYSTECIYPQFIIDGHHKTKAYIDLGIRPSIINVTKIHLKEDYDRNTWDFKSLEKIIKNNMGEK